ncbi:NAD(P)/FAD-dependent oxidoreductase [Acidiphilium sp.]|uniref:NAD(P)/FAD-dependent oxidoreductase n=1 Tax=Acidiphilium sp. TaxID=527 RepID=UPI002582581D|nr:FAD/NAD(P)-binding oxidoreductase [Acidiphilium sp.]
MTGKTILILGGGIGGVVAASRLRKALPREHRVVLVDRETGHIFPPSLLWLMVGLRKPEKISCALPVLAGKGVEIVQGVVEGIDPQNRSARVNGRDIKADYMIVALGADLAPESVQGLPQAGHDFYTLPGAESLRDARLVLRQGRIVILVSSMPFKCPAAPYEAAMLLEFDYRKRKLRDSVHFDVYTPEPGPMPVAGPVVSAAIRSMIEAKGIGFHPEHAVTAVDPAARRISFANGASADFDLLAYVPPHRAPAVVRESGLLGESGWVPVDRASLETRVPGVYAIGDVTGIMLKRGLPLPKAGVFAHRESEVVADNIAVEITGKGERRSFDGDGECFIEIGDGKAGFGSGNFYADPVPDVRLRGPNRALHLGKIAFEKYWLSGWA